MTMKCTLQEKINNLKKEAMIHQINFYDSAEEFIKFLSGKIEEPKFNFFVNCYITLNSNLEKDVFVNTIKESIQSLSKNRLKKLLTDTKWLQILDNNYELVLEDEEPEKLITIRLSDNELIKKLSVYNPEVNGYGGGVDFSIDIDLSENEVNILLKDIKKKLKKAKEWNIQQKNTIDQILKNF